MSYTYSSNHIVTYSCNLDKSLHIEKGGTMLHNIKEKCKERHLTVAELERKAGITQRTIRRWDEQEPSVYKVFRVAKVLDTTVEKLLEG